MKKSRENILITRSLDTKSVIWQLTDIGHSVIDQSFVEIEPLTITQIPQADLYFYYSKNGVKHFMNAAKALGVDLTKSKHATLGKGTATMLESYGIKADFIGQGIPSKIAASLVRTMSHLSICFVRAKQSTQSIQKHWPTDYCEVISYAINPAIVNATAEIHTILATSPMNVINALKSCNVSALKRIICIGPTTYNSAFENSNVEIFTALESSEQALLDAYIQATKA